MTTAYTIRVINQTSATKSYFVFMQPPAAQSPITQSPVTQSPGGTTPIYDNAWATFDGVTDGGYDSVTYTVETAEEPRFVVTEGAYEPGQLITPPESATAATVDFTGRPQTTADVTEHPDASFSVEYV